MKNIMCCFRCGRSELALRRSKSVNMIYRQLQSSLRDAHPRMRPCVLQICVFVICLHQRLCTNMFSQGVFVHKNAKVTFEVTMATSFCVFCFATCIAQCSVITSANIRLVSGWKAHIPWFHDSMIFHDSLFLWIWKAGINHFPQLHCCLHQDKIRYNKT